MRKTLTLILVLILCLSCTGCGAALQELGQQLEDVGQVMGDAVDAVQNPDQEKTFTNNGATLTLNTSFLDFTNTEKNTEEYAFLYANDTIGILSIAEDKKALFDAFGEMDVKGYAELIAELYELDATVEQKDGFWFYTYESTSNDVPQTFLCVFCETQDQYWNLQSYCDATLYPENQEAMWKYLTSIVFAEG